MFICSLVVSSILRGENVGMTPRRSRSSTVASSISSSQSKKQVWIKEIILYIEFCSHIKREQIVLLIFTPDFLIYTFSYGNFKIRSPLENLLVKNNPQSILKQDHLPLLLLYVAVDQAEVILVLVIESQTLPYHLKLLKIEADHLSETQVPPQTKQKLLSPRHMINPKSVRNPHQQRRTKTSHRYLPQNPNQLLLHGVKALKICQLRQRFLDLVLAKLQALQTQKHPLLPH